MFPPWNFISYNTVTSAMTILNSVTIYLTLWQAPDVISNSLWVCMGVQPLILRIFPCDLCYSLVWIFFSQRIGSSLDNQLNTGSMMATQEMLRYLNMFYVSFMLGTLLNLRYFITSLTGFLVTWTSLEGTCY